MNEVEFLHKALHSYENIQCNTTEEFNEDLNKILVIRRMLSRYIITKEIAPRLILNHIVILFNVFGSTALELLLYKIPKELYPQLYPFLMTINRIEQSDQELDQYIVEELKGI